MAEKEKNYSKAEERLKALSQEIGHGLAMYCVCASSNKPYVPHLITETWEEYVEALNEAPDYKGKGFIDGETDIRAVINNETEDTQKWEKTWGAGFTINEYKRLDSLFATYSERLIKAGGMDAKQEDTLRVCTKMRLESDKALQKGGKDNIDIAYKLNKMIQENLSEENLRKKDEKPIEEIRIDTIVDALEKAGMAKEGKILDLPQLQEQLLRRLGALGGKPSHKYPYTLDAADQMIHIIANTMYSNDSLPEITDLPDNMRFDENVSCEFASEPNADEEEAYRELGLMRERKPKKKKEAKKE